MNKQPKPVQIFTFPEKLSLGAHFAAMGLMVGGVAAYLGSHVLAAVSVGYAAYRLRVDQKDSDELVSIVKQGSDKYFALSEDTAGENRLIWLMRKYGQIVTGFTQRFDRKTPEGPHLAIAGEIKNSPAMICTGKQHNAILLGHTFFGTFNAKQKRCVLAHEAAHHLQQTWFITWALRAGSDMASLMARAKIGLMGRTPTEMGVLTVSALLPEFLGRMVGDHEKAVKVRLATEAASLAVIGGMAVATGNRGLLYGWGIAKSVDIINQCILNSQNHGCEYAADRLGIDLCGGKVKPMLEAINRLEKAEELLRGDAVAGSPKNNGPLRRAVVSMFSLRPSLAQRRERLLRHYAV